MSQTKNLLAVLGIVSGLLILTGFLSFLNADEGITGRVTHRPGCEVKEMCLESHIEEFDIEVDGEVIRDSYVVCDWAETRLVCEE